MNPTALVVMFLLLVTSLLSRILRDYHGLPGGKAEDIPHKDGRRTTYSPGSKR